MAALGVAACARAQAQDQSPAGAAKMGEKVAAFGRKDATGKSVKLADALQGARAVVLDFWSARCPVSQKYEPVLKALAAKYREQKVTFLAIDANYNESAEEVQKVGRERQITYPVLMDGAQGGLASYFGASHTPEAYLLSPRGVLLYHGNLDDLGVALDAVLAGKPIAKPETRAFGCSIKRP